MLSTILKCACIKPHQNFCYNNIILVFVSRQKASNNYYQCSSKHNKGMPTLQAFSTDFSLIWKRKEPKLFQGGHDHRPCSIHALPTCRETFFGRTLNIHKITYPFLGPDGGGGGGWKVACFGDCKD